MSIRRQSLCIYLPGVIAGDLPRRGGGKWRRGYGGKWRRRDRGIEGRREYLQVSLSLHLPISPPFCLSISSSLCNYVSPSHCLGHRSNKAGGGAGALGAGAGGGRVCRGVRGPADSVQRRFDNRIPIKRRSFDTGGVDGADGRVGDSVRRRQSEFAGSAFLFDLPDPLFQFGAP